MIFQPDVGVQPELEGFRQDPQISNDVMDFVTEIAETTTAINEYDNGEIIWSLDITVLIEGKKVDAIRFCAWYQPLSFFIIKIPYITLH